MCSFLIFCIYLLTAEIFCVEEKDSPGYLWRRNLSDGLVLADAEKLRVYRCRARLPICRYHHIIQSST